MAAVPCSQLQRSLALLLLPAAQCSTSVAFLSPGFSILGAAPRGVSPCEPALRGLAAY